ncbi:MAG: hypothetical protein RR869_08035 [Lachnospiraceae bacterium]
MKKWITRIACLIIFAICLGLIITGQRTVGVLYLVKMLVGLLGILGLLFFYNKQHQ